ncbi:MAG: RNB domain-containing ribonuclease, partial [Betaproteobacteria bacterium]|nr:RNB domain-containing ribonuclease [Betaproteobacteria bacterium]
AVRLLQRCGAIPSTAQHHFDGFLLQFFPQGRGHPDTPPTLPGALPEAGVAAFSIDDASTTEIDDAFSVSEDEGLLRFGIHIAAPALGLLRDSEIDRFAAERMSTVYLPGDKITMLPAGWVDAYTLAEHRCAPAVSLYVWCDPSDYSIRRSETRIESVAIAVNLRLDALDPVFNQATVDRDDAPD